MRCEAHPSRPVCSANFPWQLLCPPLPCLCRRRCPTERLLPPRPVPARSQPRPQHGAPLALQKSCSNSGRAATGTQYRCRRYRRHSTEASGARSRGSRQREAQQLAAAAPWTSKEAAATPLHLTARAPQAPELGP